MERVALDLVGTPCGKLRSAGLTWSSHDDRSFGHGGTRVGQDGYTQRCAEALRAASVPILRSLTDPIRSRAACLAIRLLVGRALIIRLIIQTIRLDPSGAVQIDAGHQATDLENASTADLSTVGFVLGFER
jgi:hypothetical protein